MPLDPTLLSIIACPQDHGSLLVVGDELFYNPRLRRAYPVENGIPVLLIDEARDVSEQEHAELLARAAGS